MADIDIRHPHALPLAQAREAIEQAAQGLSEKFGINYAWRIQLEPDELRVTAKLGFLLSAMKGPIESEIRRVLAERLGS